MNTWPLTVLVLLVPVGPSALAVPVLGEPLSPTLIFHGSPAEAEFGAVDLTGLDPEYLHEMSKQPGADERWQKVLACFTEEAAMRPGWPPVVGEYQVTGTRVRFQPLFPFAAGGVYTCRFSLAGEQVPPDSGPAEGVELTFTMPAPVGHAATRVTAIHPRGATVPENLLRLYIHFSAPMQRKDVQNHIRLFNSRGEEVGMPFVQVNHGLWDAESRRLTLFFHPGRIKRGVAPHESMGSVLQAGETYRLVVDGDLRDSRGYPLAAGYEQEFVVVSADRRSPEPVAWLLEAPGSAGAPVSVKFPEALDHALLERFIVVRDAGGTLVSGRVMVSVEGDRWSFIPGDSWGPGAYTLVVNPALEDLAGNSLDRLFDQEGEPGSGVGMAPATREFRFSVPMP
jgi:hypothetical protein